MARKDVQLVIRAKNEASGALNSVAQSLDKVNKELLENVKTGKTASGGMDALGADVANLAKRLEGLRGIGAAAQGLNSVKQSVATMGATLSKTANDFVTFSRQARQMGSALAAQREEAARLTQTLASQEAAMRAARELTLKRSAATKELTAAEKALKAEQNKTTKSDEAIAQATQRITAAKAAVDAYAAEYTRLRGQVESSVASLRELNGAIREQEKAYNRVSNAAKNSINDARQQKTLIDETVSSYNKLSAEVAETGNKLGAMTTDQKQLAAATAEAEQALREQTAAMAAMQRFSTGTAGGFADPKTAAALREQRAEIDQARAAWKALETDIRRQAEAMRGVAQPTEAANTALRNSISAAQQAKAEYQRLEQQARATANSMKGLVVGQADAHVKAFNATLRDTPNNPPRNAWQAFYRSIYGESRTAMSWTQRLRGEVLALGTAYLGLYGVINQAGGVIKAYQGIEAAQNRLGVVFKQNGEQVRNELLWLERQAARLGIEFGTLSDQYGKFAVSAQAANFSNSATRDIFMAVAEAGRVAKLSNEQLQGTFLALEQMISKSKVQAEELRGQLGERLPGAVSIFAKALGVTTAELSKMMEQGQVLADQSTMLKFAEELNKQFGPQLAESLQSTSAQIGRFFNNLYQAQLQVARGGFIEGLTKALAELDKWFQSREGRDFFLSLGAAAGKLMEVMAQLPQYFGLVGDAIKIIVALKIGSWLGNLIGGMQTAGVVATATATKFTSWGAVLTATQSRVTAIGATLKAFQASLSTIPASLTAMGTGFTLVGARAAAARASLSALNATILTVSRAGGALLTAFGGWVGVVAAAVTFIGTGIIADWVGGVDDATAAIDEHERILGRVLTAYENLNGVVDDWRQGIEDVNVQAADANFIKQTEIYEQSIRDIEARLLQLRAGGLAGRALTDLFSDEQVRKIRSFADQFDRLDKTNINQFAEAVGELYVETTDFEAKKMIGELVAMTQASLEAAGRVDEAAAFAAALGSTLEGLGYTTEEAKAKIQEMTQAAKESGEGLDEGKSAAEEYQESLRKLRDMLPSVTEEMKKLQDASSLDNVSLESARAALAAGQGLGDTMNAYGRANAEQRLLDIDTTPLVSSLDLNSQALKDFYNEIRGQANTGAQRFQGITLDQLKSAAWQNANLATVTTSSGFKQQVHKEAAAAMQGFLNELESTGYRINQFGGFNPRPKKDTRGNFIPGTISEHSYGYAIDINWDKNPYLEKLVTDFPDQIGMMAAKYGLSWGGDWRGKKDAMHFEYTGRQAPGTQAGTDFQLQQQEKVTAELLKQNQIRDDYLSGMDREAALQRIKASGDERALAQRIALNEAQDKGITDSATLYKVAAEAGRVYDAEQAARVAEQQAATDQELVALQQKIDYQELVNAGKERQAVIEQGIREAIAADPSLANDEAKLAKLEELIGKNYDLANAENARTTATEAAEQRVNQLMEYRSTLMDNLRMQMEMGDTAGAEQTRVALEGVNAELQAAIQNAIQMWQAIGGPQADAAIAKLRNTQMQIQGTRNQMGAFGLSMQQWQGVAQNFASGLTGVFKRFAQAIGQGEDAMQALGEAFLEFAANFLIQIGEMIIQQALFNSMQGMGGGGGGFGGILGGLFGFGHTGGLVGRSGFIGSGNMAKSWSDILPTFHDGGVVGLGPNETLNVLKVGEEVLTRNDPRHVLNGGNSPSVAPAQAPSIKIVNSFDSADVVSEGLQSSVGEEVLMNVVRRNASNFKDIINGA